MPMHMNFLKLCSAQKIVGIPKLDLLELVQVIPQKVLA